MHFAKTTLALLAVASSALAITINTPSPDSYWVQNTSNTISWSFSANDPNPVNIVVSNSNSSFLNGNFSIATGVDLSNGSFTVTNVTLRVAPGYTVHFANVSNQEQIYASSQDFEVRDSGTTPASVSIATSTPTSASDSTTGTSTSTATGDSASETNAALRSLNVGEFPALPIFVSAGLAVAGSLLAL